MPKVTKDYMQRFIEVGGFPPRHQRGCPKNYARCLPLAWGSQGLSVEELKVKVREAYDDLPCECKEADVLREW